MTAEQCTQKQSARSAFRGSDRLFNACWNHLLGFCRLGAIKWPSDQAEINNWLDSIASEKVNNPRSRFYIHG